VSLVAGLATRVLPRLFNTVNKQRLSILIYHRVLAEHDPLRPDEPTAAQFEWQMRALARDFHPMSLCDAVSALEANTLPERAVCVTFDDGYADNEQVALPLLKKYDIPATVFVSTGFLNGGRMWNDSVIEAVRRHHGKEWDLTNADDALSCYALANDQEKLQAIDAILSSIKHYDLERRANIVSSLVAQIGVSLPNDLMMTDEQVLNLSRSGVEIGAHTVHHPILDSIPNDQAQAEIADSKGYLEHILQHPVHSFAYPNGQPGKDYQSVHRDMVESLGFRVAVSTHWGVSTAESDRFQLPRFTPWDTQEHRFVIRLLANLRQVDPLIS